MTSQPEIRSWDDEMVISWNETGPTLLCRRKACWRTRAGQMVPWEGELPPNCTAEDVVSFADGHRSTHR